MMMMMMMMIEHHSVQLSKPSQSVQDLWDNPAAVADFLNLDKTIATCDDKRRAAGLSQQQHDDDDDDVFQFHVGILEV